MVKMIDGRIACRISLAPESYGKKFYCDHCGEFFDDRASPPCEAVVTVERVTVDEFTVDLAAVAAAPMIEPPATSGHKRKRNS